MLLGKAAPSASGGFRHGLGVGTAPMPPITAPDMTPEAALMTRSRLRRGTDSGRMTLANRPSLSHGTVLSF